MTLWDLVLTRGIGDPFTKLSLERIEKQNLSFLKPRIDIPKMQFIALIPLAVIGYFILKK